MTGPENLPTDASRVDTRVTGIIPLDLPEDRGIGPITPAPAYKPEPVFNKKVMIAWALGAAAVWFTVKFITPIAIESARTAIIETVKEVKAQDPGTTVTITRNGKVLTITRTHGGPAIPAAAATGASQGSSVPDPAAAPAPAPKKIVIPSPPAATRK